MTHLAPQNDGEDALLPLPDILLAVARELERVRSLGWRIEKAVCMLAVQAGVDDKIIGELQQLDAMQQQVAALHDFLLALSGAQLQPALLPVSAALERVTLSDVKERLSGGAWTSAASGVLELF